MERTFTIFHKKFQYKKETRQFIHILGYQGKRRQRFTIEYTPKEFIIRILYLHLIPEIEIKHTCRNREMKKILEKYLSIAQEMVVLGGPEQYLIECQKKSAQVYLKYWNLPTECNKIVLDFF